MQPELHITELTQKMQWCHYPDRNDWIGRLPGYFRKGSTNGCAPGTTLFQDIAAARKGFQLDRRHRPLPGFCVRLSAHPPRLYPRIQTLALRRRDLFPDPDGHFRIRRCEYAPSPRLHPMGRRRGAPSGNIRHQRPAPAAAGTGHGGGSSVPLRPQDRRRPGHRPLPGGLLSRPE